MKFRPLTWLMIGFVKGWRAVISPLYGNVCKYHPSCSAYGLRCLQEHGAFKGGALTVWRILRCNPWSLGGYDPVPGTPEAAQWAVEQAQRAGRAPGAASPSAEAETLIHSPAAGEPSTRGDL